MKNFLNQNSIKLILIVTSIALFVKILWVALAFLSLPLNGVSHVEKKSVKSIFYRVKLTPNKIPVPMIKKRKKRKKREPKIVKRVVKVSNIKDIKLLALYNSTSSHRTIVTVRYKSITRVLSRGKSINGFTLEGGGLNFAIFSRDSERYKISLQKNIDKNIDKKRIPSKLISRKQNQSTKVKNNQIVDAGDHKIIDRSLITHYIKNPNDIYKDIGIIDLKKGKEILGFKISFVKRGSPFAKLGLKRGDVLKSMNGQELNSYAVAFNQYKNIGSLENLTLGIKRRNKDMELEYEIK